MRDDDLLFCTMGFTIYDGNGICKHRIGIDSSWWIFADHIDGMGVDHFACMVAGLMCEWGCVNIYTVGTTRRAPTRFNGSSF